MPASTLSVLRERVLERATVIGSDPGMPPAKVTAAINSALRQIALEHDWPWLQKTATIPVLKDVRTYPVPSDWLRTIHLLDAVTGVKLTLAHLESVDSYGTRTGLPTTYAIYGGAFVLGPTPSASESLTHRYVSIENVLSSDQNTPLVPQEFEEGVVEYGAYLVLRQLKETARAKECLTAYQEWKQRAEDNIRQGREPMRIQHRPGGWL